MSNKIWHPSDLNSAEWLIAGSQIPDMNWIPQVIPNAGTAEFLNLAESLKRVLRLDKPDLIVTLGIDGVDIPVVSIELTTTTPQSQHAKQRVPRLVAAAEAGIPAIYIIPKRKISGGTQYSLGNDLYYGIDRIQTINNVPILIYHYPDIEGVLDHDDNFPNQPRLSAPTIERVFRTIDTIVRYRITNPAGDSGGLYEDSWIAAEIAGQNSHGALADVCVANYGTLTEISTSQLYEFLRDTTAMTRSRIEKTIARLPDRINSRPDTIVFQPGGRLFAHANDPYSGMLAFFDYAFCRTGRSVEERAKNLIYMPLNDSIYNIKDEFAPSGYHKYWQDKCPFCTQSVPTIDQQFTISHHLQYGCVFTKIKPLRILGYFSDMIVFQDSILVF